MDAPYDMDVDSTRSAFWDRLFDSNLDLLLHVLDSCSPASLINLAATCRLYRAILKNIFEECWDINRHLGRFFSDPLAFRNLQARTATLISGSNALQFFDRKVYSGSDLDLYVYKEHLDEVCRWVMAEGYVFVPKHRQDRDFEVAVNKHPRTLYNMRGIKNIIDLEHPLDGRKIQVMSAKMSPMEIVLFFHSTCVMNVISFEKAYSLYPRATFEERRSLIIPCSGPSQTPALEKYDARGWHILPGTPESEQLDDHSAFCSIERWIGDKYTWVIDLNMDGIVAPRQQDCTVDYGPILIRSPVAVTSWQLRYEDASEEASMTCEHLGSNGLQYPYTVTNSFFWSRCLAWNRSMIRHSRSPEPDPSHTPIDGLLLKMFQSYHTSYASAFESLRSVTLGAAQAGIQNVPSAGVDTTRTSVKRVAMRRILQSNALQESLVKTIPDVMMALYAEMYPEETDFF